MIALFLLIIIFDFFQSKCEKYWPNNDDIDEIDEQSSHSTVPKLSFDDITIELIDETLENDFVVRELKLTKVS